MPALVAGLAGLAVVVVGWGIARPAGRGRRQRRGVRRRVAAWVGIVGLLIVVWPPGVVAAGAWVVLAPHARRWRAAALADRRVRHALPDAIDAVVLAIRAGCTPYQALEVLVPVLPAPFGPACAEVLQRHRNGARFAQAVEALVEHTGERTRLLALALAADDGLALGPRLESLAADARAERRRAAEGAARRLPVTLSFPLVVCVLPAFVLVTVVPLLVGALGQLQW